MNDLRNNNFISSFSLLCKGLFFFK